MGKNKLKKFSDLEGFNCVLQYPREALLNAEFDKKGRWCGEIFPAHGPITLELGCGRGEYTVGLAKANPERNYIGVDIKGARIWTGAKTVEEEKISNAAFLRAEIESIDAFFAPGEIDEIWLTFPDPQMKKTRKRLTSSRFLSLYSKFLRPDGLINLKTDSPFLFEYTKRLVKLNNLEIVEITDDLYASGMADPVSSIKTYYESQWLSRGKKIKLISFRLNNNSDSLFPLSASSLIEPDISDLEKDDYRAYPRHTITS